MDRTVRFWRDLIGMKLAAALGRPGFRQFFFRISECELLVFFEWPGVEPIQEKGHGTPASGPLGFDHVSLGVETTDDLFVLKDKLNAADIWVSEVIDHGFIHSIYTFDPNGIAVEFSCITGKAEWGAEPVISGSVLSETAEEGADPNPDAWPGVGNPTGCGERKVYPGDFFFFDAKRQKT